MKSITKHSIILFAFFVTCSLFPDTSARPNGVNQLFTVLAPSATGKPGTGDYTARDFVNDGMKNNLAFLHEVCPPLARIADQLCQAVQSIVDRCIKFFVNGGNMPKAGGDTTTTPATTDSGSTTESTVEETTPSSGSGYDNSNPKFGGGQSTSSESSSSSESTSSTESSTDKSEGDTTTAKQ